LAMLVGPLAISSAISEVRWLGSCFWIADSLR
jgi:hypothetical protein